VYGPQLFEFSRTLTTPQISVLTAMGDRNWKAPQGFRPEGRERSPCIFKTFLQVTKLLKCRGGQPQVITAHTTTQLLTVSASSALRLDWRVGAPSPGRGGGCLRKMQEYDTKPSVFIQKQICGSLAMCMYLPTTSGQVKLRPGLQTIVADTFSQFAGHILYHSGAFVPAQALAWHAKATSFSSRPKRSKNLLYNRKPDTAKTAAANLYCS